MSVLTAVPVVAAGPTYEDVTSITGMAFNHDAGSLCVPPIGVGSAWADFDGDGDVDHFITQRSGANGMFRNVGDTNGNGLPNFEDVAAAAGIDDPTGFGHGAVFVDMDNDGDQDLYVTNHGGNTLYRNDGDTSGDGVPDFVDITATAGVADSGRAITAAWGDFNNDSLLDLFITKHIECEGNENSQDHLFMNMGGGVFTDVTSYLCNGAATCPEVEGLGFTAAWVDYDNDRDPDLYLVNDDIVGAHQPNRLWRNDGPDGSGGWAFSEVSAALGADTSLNGMGLGVADYNKDGYFDFAFSNGGPAVLLQNNGGTGFTDVSVASGVNAATVGTITWGTAFFDHDFDGDEDLYITAGNISAGGIDNIFLDNNGDGTFTDISVSSGLNERGRARAATMNDFDADGWVDIWVGNYSQPSVLLRNTAVDSGFSNNWVAITVEGVESNRDGIGTRLELTSALGTQIREINSGPTHGGGDQRVAWFGVADDTTADLVVKWPNGVDQTIPGIALGQYHHLVEPTSGASGDVTGYVFRDLDANGVEDGADGPMAGVAVAVVDSGGSTFNATTNASGAFVVSGADPGPATVTYTTPAGATLTTGNDVQVVTVVDGGSVAADDVGFLPAPSGNLSGRVFADDDGNGIEDGGDTGLPGASVSITDAAGTLFVVTTDANGDYLAEGLAPGDATVVYTSPAGYNLTTGNDNQTVAIVVDQTTAADPVGYQSISMTQPDIRRIQGDDTIEAGTIDTITVVVDGYEDGATWSFSGTGLSVSNVVQLSSRRYQVTVDADVGAAPGRRDVNVTNPGGLSDTLVDGIEVLPGVGSTNLAGHVFTDLDGNGIEDGSDTGLAGVGVEVTDSGGTVFSTTTNVSGDFLVSGLAAGDATVVVVTPSGYTLTTGNDTQTVTVVDAVTNSADPVGFQPPAGPAPDIIRVSGSGVINQGTVATVRVIVTGYVAGGTWSVSGNGVSVTGVADLGGRVELTLDVAIDAELTARDLMLVNPDGQADTLPAALIVRA